MIKGKQLYFNHGKFANVISLMMNSYNEFTLYTLSDELSTILCDRIK